MRGPRALTTFVAMFTANWRDSNYTIRASDHKNRRTIKIKTVEIRIEAFMEPVLPTTVASDSASHAPMALASSSAALRAAWKTPKRISS